MWFLPALGALVMWSASDLFSKLGCYDSSDKRSHLKMVAAVGLVMGLHAAWSLLTGSASVTGADIVAYLPVSALYILSMAIGYAGLRYIELSISSPVCNASGVFAAVLLLISGETLPPAQLAVVGLISAAVVALGIIELREDETVRALRQQEGNRQYVKSALALLLPVAYCLLDAAGTFADAMVLETLDPNAANTAYELTFFAVGAAAAVYLYIIKREKLVLRASLPRLGAAVFETVGQFAYIHALDANAAAAAPMISAYCALSVLWSRIFLREKLTWKHYTAIAVAIAGIILLAVFDP